VLEQLYSPLVVQSSPAHEELKEIAKGCVTRHHSHHYLGFAATQWSLFQKEGPPQVKALLYVYRVLLTGIHLMRTGQIEANLITLNEDFRLPYIGELVSRKIHGAEKSKLETPEVEFYRAEYERLVANLEIEAAESTLPEETACREALNDLLIRVRLRP
jgi:predicted nucleotidyltransferase